MKRTNPAILAVLVCASAPFAIVHATGAPADTASPADRLATFVGDGVCSGHMVVMGNHPGPATSGKFHGEKVLDDHWVVMHYRQDPSEANPKPFEVAEYFGYDPASKRFLVVMVGNGDGVYSTGASTNGWKDHTITFDEVEMSRGKPGHTREAFTTGDSGLAGYAAWFRDPKGTWIKVDEETCHKT